VPGMYTTGVLFQASQTEQTHVSELNFANGFPGVRWADAGGQKVQLTSPMRLAPHTPAVLAFTSAPGAQQLRVNSAVVASAAATFAPSAYTQLLLGWGYLGYFPRAGFRGNIYAAMTGKGAPSAAELAVLEKYLGAVAGITVP
jgi:endoglucanase